jgi:hypothetical protein
VPATGGARYRRRHGVMPLSSALPASRLERRQGLLSEAPRRPGCRPAVDDERLPLTRADSYYDRNSTPFAMSIGPRRCR